MPATERIAIIYDGDCGLCVRALGAIRRLDWRGVTELYDSHESELIADRFPMLAGADFDQAMFAVTPQGAVYRGYFAFKAILRRLPLTWPLLLFFYIPGAGRVGPRVYAWVARNRRTLGCSSDACEMPASRPVRTPESR